jgi:hypothetical protein
MSLNSSGRNAYAPTHSLPRTSIGNHKQPFSTVFEKNNVAVDPLSQSSSG